jgi:hypothetical protein
MRGGRSCLSVEKRPTPPCSPPSAPTPPSFGSPASIDERQRLLGLLGDRIRRGAGCTKVGSGDGVKGRGGLMRPTEELGGS